MGGDFSSSGTIDLVRKELLYTIKESLPKDMHLIAYNFSRSNISMYSLLCRKNKMKGREWLTLRTADHPLWLKNARQLSVDLGNPADLTRLSERLKKIVKSSAFDEYSYRISAVDAAALEFIDECQQYGLIWAVRLPEEISAAHKKVPLDLAKDFTGADLFIGSRNNLNSLLLPVESKRFQLQLKELFGRNLLFSQFSSHSLLRLLPTNQWIQPIIQKEAAAKDWKERIAQEYGQGLIDVYKEAINKQKSNRESRSND